MNQSHKLVNQNIRATHTLSSAQSAQNGMQQQSTDESVGPEKPSLTFIAYITPIKTVKVHGHYPVLFDMGNIEQSLLKLWKLQEMKERFEESELSICLNLMEKAIDSNNLFGQRQQKQRQLANNDVLDFQKELSPFQIEMIKGLRSFQKCLDLNQKVRDRVSSILSKFIHIQSTSSLVRTHIPPQSDPDQSSNQIRASNKNRVELNSPNTAIVNRQSNQNIFNADRIHAVFPCACSHPLLNRSVVAKAPIKLENAQNCVDKSIKSTTTNNQPQMIDLCNDEEEEDNQHQNTILPSKQLDVFNVLNSSHSKQNSDKNCGTYSSSTNTNDLQSQKTQLETPVQMQMAGSLNHSNSNSNQPLIGTLSNAIKQSRLIQKQEQVFRQSTQILTQLKIKNLLGMYNQQISTFQSPNKTEIQEETDCYENLRFIKEKLAFIKRFS
ncbi:UNKNOWN [Stylonychia lemnae]|uniref:Uncharacterized protein n=1 Tax=Stylonychia lemnae TaxID=5949 RepID=A0A078B604_STYLE|nr:UNKNOWN [Stylonychia lemnae]|eukprot:CDW88923.1 UNKNOWN [Stylonychia lemnae]